MKPKWESVPLPPDVSKMSEEERAEFFRHLENGTLPVRLVSPEEMRRMYGGAQPPDQ